MPPSDHTHATFISFYILSSLNQYASCNFIYKSLNELNYFPRFWLYESEDNTRVSNNKHIRDNGMRFEYY